MIAIEDRTDTRATSPQSPRHRDSCLVGPMPGRFTWAHSPVTNSQPLSPDHSLFHRVLQGNLASSESQDVCGGPISTTWLCNMETMGAFVLVSLILVVQFGQGGRACLATIVRPPTFRFVKFGQGGKSLGRGQRTTLGEHPLGSHVPCAHSSGTWM